MDILAVVSSLEGERVCLSQRELLGTWEENAALFSQGETVAGIVRSIEDYGIFVELTPNLAGLAEPREGVKVGQHAGVYIKSILPEKMKLKLILIDAQDAAPTPPSPPRYFLTKGHISRWVYSRRDAASGWNPSSIRTVWRIYKEPAAAGGPAYRKRRLGRKASEPPFAARRFPGISGPAPPFLSVRQPLCRSLRYGKMLQSGLSYPMSRPRGGKRP